jgi:hypothetical protein
MLNTEQNKKLDFSLKSKTAASQLVELAVVIGITGILATSVTVSRSLINSAKVNSIYQDASALRDNFNIFTQVYQCLPGECSNDTLVDLFKLPNVGAITNVSSCGTAPAVSNAIDTVSKRSCAMASLQAYGGFVGVVDQNAIPANSDVNKNMPRASFDKNAAWDLRAFVIGNGKALPAELGMPVSPINSTMHAFILRSSTNTNDINGDTTTTTTMSAISANLAKAVDNKYDTGLPLSGNIRAGKNPVVDGNGTNCHSTPMSNYTYAAVLGGATAITATFGTANNTYVNSTDSGTPGCILAFLFNVQ